MGPNNLLINFVNFGLYHYNKSNFAEAEKLFEIGYKMGCYDCCYMVGIICKNLEKFEKAFEHFKLASENGIKDASINLAHCYLEGIGVEKNFNKGVELLLQNNLNE
jgi:TPR repeat protein